MINVAQKNRDSYPTYGTTESARHITMRDGYQSEIRVISPPSPQAKRTPLVTLVYGGGFIGGSCLQDIPLARSLAALYGATVVTVSYRTAPEHKFPTAPHDVWDTVLWLSQNASELGADPSQGWVLGGNSAGANLAAVAAHRALKENLSPPLTGLSFAIPSFLKENIVPDKYKQLWFSREQNSDAPTFNKKHLAKVEDLYEPDPQSDDWSPFRSDAPFSALPPVHVLVCGMDPLRDDGLVYERALRENGVKTRLNVYAGLVHGHYVTFPDLKQSVKARIDILAGFGWLLGKEVEREAIVPFERFV
jgi:acetyl esterase/lipase